MAFMKALVLFLLAPTVSCLAQQVTVRVVDIKNGQPLKGEKVVIQFFAAHPSLSPTTVQTDVNGETHFVVPNPTPEYVDVHVFLKSEHWHCGCWVYARTNRVLQQGVVQSPATKMRQGIQEAAGKPGEIVIVARPLTFFEKLLYPLVKG